jgi:Ca-activated chloride channel family protein
MATASVATRFMPVAAETGQEIRLAMQRLWLTGRVLPVGARLQVHHTFRSSESKPIEVIYAFGLPRDAALRRFRVSGEGFSVRSELKVVEEAVRAYEQGIQAGHLASLARQYGDGLINLTLGNIRPGETVTVVLEVLAGVEAHDDSLRFRFPFTLAPGYHRQARAAEVAPGMGELELPESEFGDLILPRFAADASDLHEVGFDLQVWVPQQIEEVASPSHALRVVKEGPECSRASLATERDVPDRDLVLDVRAKDSLAGLLAGVDKEGRGRFAAIVPSTSFGERAGGPRQVVFVLDRSGSMNGHPMAQARKALEACLGALAREDRFGLVAFDDRVEVFKPSLTEGTSESREEARRFLKGIDARGGTELAAGVVEAARLLGRAGGDILVLTDGQVFGTEAILAQARETGARIHCLGIGSASQDRFLALLARESGGVSRFLTPRERVDLPAVDLFASIGRPVARDLEVKLEGIPGGQIAPEPPRAVFAGSPLVVFGEAEGAAQGELVLQWDGGRKAVPLQVGQSELGETLRLLTGARLITDLESRYAEAGEGGAAARRQEGRVDRRLEALSQTFGLASRRMALVAVVERAGDRPGEIPETKVVPVGMPQDTQFGSYFRTQQPMPCAAAMPTAAPGGLFSFLRPRARPRAEMMPRISLMAGPAAEPTEMLEMEVGPSVEDTLLELAARIEPDGGMPGRDEEERVQAAILALLCFLAEGHTERSGAFRSHVARLMAFLEAARGVHPLVGEILELARRGRSLEGDWSQHGPGAGIWKELEAALRKTTGTAP